MRETSDVFALKVLVADDHKQWQDIITGSLTPEYTVVDVVANGDDVVARASAAKPDVVTLDVSMPGISGLNLLPDLRAELPHAAIVMLTTSCNPLYIEEAYARGADAYVVKSRAGADLLPAIQSALQVSRARQQSHQNLPVGQDFCIAPPCGPDAAAG